METIKIMGSGLCPERWENFRVFFSQELIKTLNEAKKEKSISLEKLGEECGYSKSQIDNFLKGRTEMDEATCNRMVEFLEVNDKVRGAALFEKLQRAVIRQGAPDMNAEDVERAMASFQDDSQEYIQWEQQQKRQLEEMETWFLDMDIKDCYLLDEYFRVYEKAKIPETAAGFIRNYAAMEVSEREQLKSCMELVTIPVKILYNQIHLVERFQKLACMREEDIARDVKQDLVQEGREELHTSQEFLQIRKREHWESFRNKIVDSPYVTGDYFYEWMRFLTQMDGDMWEALTLFLMMGDFSIEGMTQWQNLFDSIVPDAE